LGTDDSGGKSLFGREFEELIFPDILGMIIVGEEFGLILDIGSDKSGVGVDLPDFVLGREVVLFWIGISEVIIFNRGGKEEV
jgi:hypothetical protein